MLLRAYSIYDCKALQYHSPWFAATDGSALRSFSDLANDKQNRIGAHPRDYSLYYVGTWDDSNGTFTPNVPVHVMDAQALVIPQPSLFKPDGQ